MGGGGNTTLKQIIPLRDTRTRILFCSSLTNKPPIKRTEQLRQLQSMLIHSLKTCEGLSKIDNAKKQKSSEGIVSNNVCIM